MNTVWCAFAGEYEVAHPLGVFDTLETAKRCVEQSDPSYTTEVIGYDTSTGKPVEEWEYKEEYFSTGDPHRELYEDSFGFTGKWKWKKVDHVPR